MVVGISGGASIWSELIMVWKSDFMRKSSDYFRNGFALIFSLCFLEREACPGACLKQECFEIFCVSCSWASRMTFAP